jgi:hypothetical protein
MEFNKEKILKNSAKIFKYLGKGIAIWINLFFITFLVTNLLILIKYPDDLKQIKDFHIYTLRLFLFYIIFTLYSIPVMAFFSYKIDKIREKIEHIIKNKIIIKNSKYLLIKVFMASLIALFCFFSQSLASNIMTPIEEIPQIKNLFSTQTIEIFILSFIFPLIYVFPFTYL